MELTLHGATASFGASIGNHTCHADAQDACSFTGALQLPCNSSFAFAQGKSRHVSTICAVLAPSWCLSQRMG